MTQPKKRLPNGMGIAFGMGLGFILGWLFDEVVWGLAIGRRAGGVHRRGAYFGRLF